MTLDYLKERRSTRDFDKNYVIPKEILEDIINTTLRSPTAVNAEEVNLICITNKELISKLNKAAFDSIPNEEMKQFLLLVQKENGNEQPVTYDCSALVLFVANKEKTKYPAYVSLDGGIACGMFMAAVASYGLQSVPIGFLVNPKVEEAAGLERGSLILAIGIGKSRNLPNKEKVVTSEAKFIE